jgi:RHH-type transcriptional regulator, rel operon repressor / antitoxin RelB
MLALRLPKEIEDRLAALAKKTGRTKSFYARRAILEFMEDLEDLELGLQRLREDDGVRYSMADILSDLEEDEAAASMFKPAAE